MLYCTFLKINVTKLQFYSLGPLAPDPTSELDIFGHYSNPLGMDGAQVSILEQSHQVGLTCLLQSHYSRTLEPEIGLEILGNLPDKALERQLTDEQLRGLLISPYFPESHGPRPVPVRLLDSSCGRGRFPSSFGSELLPRSFPSSGLPGSLLSASHYSSKRARAKYKLLL